MKSTMNKKRAILSICASGLASIFTIWIGTGLPSVSATDYCCAKWLYCEGEDVACPGNGLNDPSSCSGTYKEYGNLTDCNNNDPSGNPEQTCALVAENVVCTKIRQCIDMTALPSKIWNPLTASCINTYLVSCIPGCTTASTGLTSYGDQMACEDRD